MPCDRRISPQRTFKYSYFLRKCPYRGLFLICKVPITVGDMVREPHYRPLN